MFRWTPAHDEYLLKTTHLSAREIAICLGITPHAVYCRRSKIGLTFHKKLQGRSIAKGETRKWPPTIKMVRDFIFLRDNYSCHYCGQPANQIDHKVPLSHGGNNVTTNLVASCARCNNLKGNACYECPRWRELINV
jgi:hypothetical protein